MPTLYYYELGWAETADGGFASGVAGTCQATEGGPDITLYDADGNQISQITTNSNGRIQPFKLEIPVAYIQFGAGPRKIWSNDVIENAANIQALTDTAAAAQNAADLARQAAEKSSVSATQAANVAAAAGMDTTQITATVKQNLLNDPTFMASAGAGSTTATDTTDYAAIIANMTAHETAGGL